MVRRGMHRFLLYALVPALAVVITMATGLWQTGFSGNGGVEYGFPLAWKIVQLIPTCAYCPLPTSDNWAFFLIDTAFYATVGYGVTFLYAKLTRRQLDYPNTQEKQAALVPRE